MKIFFNHPRTSRQLDIHINWFNMIIKQKDRVPDPSGWLKNIKSPGKPCSLAQQVRVFICAKRGYQPAFLVYEVFTRWSTMRHAVPITDTIRSSNGELSLTL